MAENVYDSIKPLISSILDKIATDKNITDECNSVFAKLSYDKSNLTAEHYFGQNKKYSKFEEIMEKMFYDEPSSKNDYNNYSILNKDETIKRSNIEKIKTEKDKYYRLCNANYLELISLTIENAFIVKSNFNSNGVTEKVYLEDVLNKSFGITLDKVKKCDKTDKEIAKNFISTLTKNRLFFKILTTISYDDFKNAFESIEKTIKNFRELLTIKPSMDRFFNYLDKTKISNDYKADKIKKDIINNNLKKYDINENNKIGLDLKANDLNIQKIKLALPKINKLLEYLGEDSLNSEAIELEKKFNLINKIKSLLKAKDLDLDVLKSINDTLINLYKHELETILDYTSDIFYNKDLEATINKKQIEVKNESLINEYVLELCYHLPDRELLNTIKVYISTIEVIRDIILEIKKSLTEKLNFLENEEYLLRSKFLKKIYNNFMELVSKETIFSSEKSEKSEKTEKTEKTEDENRKLLVLTLDKIFKNLTFEVFITEGLTKKLIEKYIIKNKLYFTDNGIKKLDKLKSEYDKLILKIEFLKAGYSDNYKSLLKQSNLRLALKGISIFGLNVGVSLFEGTRFDAKKVLAADELKSKMDELRPIFQKARPSLDLDSEVGQKLLRTFAKKELDKDNKLGLWNIVRLVNPFSSSSRSLGRENIKSWWSNKVKSSSTAHTVTQTFTAFGALASALKNIATLDAKSFTKNIWKATTSIFSAIFLPPENVRQKMRAMKDEAKRTKKKQKEELKRIKGVKKFLDKSLGKEESNFSDLSISEATKNVFSTTADKFADFFSDNEDSNLSGNEKSGIMSSIKNIFGMFSSKAAEQIKKDLSVTDKSDSNNSNTTNSKPKKGISGNLKDLMLTSKLSWFATMSSKLFEAGVETAGGNSKEDKEFKKETLGFGRTITDYLRKFWDSYSKKETRKAPNFEDKKDNNIYIGNSETLKNPEVKKEPWWKKLLGLLPFMLPFLGKLLSSILGFFGIDSKKVFRFLRFLFKFSWGVIKTSFKILRWIGKHCWKALKWFFTDGLKKIKWLFNSIAEVSGKIIRFLGLDKILNSIINFFKNPIKSVGDIFGKLLKGSAGFLSSLKNFVIDIVGGAIKLFVDGLVKVGVLSGEIAKSVIKGLGIKSLNKSFFNSELQASEEAVKNATKNAKKLDFTKTKDLSFGEKVLATLNKIVESIGSFLKGAFDLLAKMWSIAIDFIKNPSWESFKKAGVEIIKAVKGSFTDALSYLKSAYENFKGVTASFIKTCIENARNTYEAVKNKAAQCWNTFKSLTNPKALFSKLMSFVQLLLSPSSVKGTFKAMKAIPLVNIIAAAGFALYYLSQGKWVAAVCEIIAVLITVFSGGIACAVSIALSLSSEKIQEAYDEWTKKAEDDKKRVYAVGDKNEKNFTETAKEGAEESDNFQKDLNNITPEKILDLFKTVDVNDIQTSDTVLNDIYGSDYSSLSDENIKQKIADKNNFDSTGLNGNSADSKADFVSNTVKNVTNNTIDYNNINNINASVTNVDFGFDTGDNPYKITKIGNDNAYVFGKPEGSNVAAYSFRKQGVVIENPDGTYEVRTGGTKAWRNNNPGNIRFSKWMWRNTKPIGVDYNGFLIYRTQDEGQRAIGFLLKNSGKYKNKTIPNAIETYAPRNENNTDAYIRHVKRAFLNANLGDVESRTISSLNRMEMDLLVGAIKSKEGNMAGSVKTSTKENLSSEINSSYNEVANTYTNKAPSYSTPSTPSTSVSSVNGAKGSVSATGNSGDVLTNKAPQNQVSEANILTTQALIEKQKELVKTISELKADLDLVKKDNQTGDFKLFNGFISWYEM